MSGTGEDRMDDRGGEITPPATGASGIPKTGRVLVIWTIASVIAGIVGAGISVAFGAPYYFGFFLALVLVGLAGLFALAAHVDQHQHRRR